VRYSLLGLNIVVLIAVVLFVLRTPHSQAVSTLAVTNTSVDNNSTLADPLDQLSSADIAQSVATLTNLPEATAVRNQAESVSADLASAPSEGTIANKPQIVATSLKSVKDIQKYTTVAGDTVSSLAAKFNVTSNSILWSNSLNSNTLSAGQQLVIPPVNGIVYTVKSGDTPQSLAQKYSANADEITAFNDAEINGLQPGEQIVIPGGQVTAPTPTTPTFAFGGAGFVALYGSNGYDYGFCTWYVASQISVPNNWGNASSWAYYAALSGWTVSSTPIVGAIAQTANAAGGEGHVAIVTAVSADGSQIQFKDMNGLAGWGRVGYSGWVSTSTYQHYIYH
jgi:LysM repeat protein